MPKRTPVPGYASVATSQTPIIPPAAPAPLSAAPLDEPVSSVWPETLGERPSLRSAIAATEVPAPTPPREEAPTPEGEAEAEVGETSLDALTPPDAYADALADAEDDDQPLPEPSGLSIADLAHEVEDDEPEELPEAEPAAEEPELESEDEAERPASRSRVRRGGRNGRGSTAVLEAAPEVDEAEASEDTDDEPQSSHRSVNTLAILALAIGVLACPLAALFGHLALGQLKTSGERGVIPAWIAVVLGYLWLGFWIVFGVSFLAANG